MANTFQQRSRIRKAIYGGLILVLFTVAILHRNLLIRTQADSLALREESQGEVELTGSAMRLALTGFKGMATCFLWVAAREKQTKQEWNEMEMLVNSVAKLQPHFISPWLFQSWNIAFNVSVECDSEHDKYFYIARGIQLLAEGERRNRGRDTPGGEIIYPGNPDLRFHMGFYYQLKIGQSDQARTFRSLFQMRCMEPAERDPAKLETRSSEGRRVVDMAKFRSFCNKHPRLVRRLRDQLGCETPELVVDFLRENQDIPSRYDANQNFKKNAVDRFPVLPPSFKTGTRYYDEDDFEATSLLDDFDNFAAAREWYLFAQEPLPDPDPNFAVDGWPQYDVNRHRLPHMTHYIFRQYPALSQSNVANLLAEEGWFDQLGWTIKSEVTRPVWFKTGGTEEYLTVGAKDPRYSAAAAWKAYLDRFTQFGTSTRLMMPEAQAGTPLRKQYEALLQEEKLFKQRPPGKMPEPDSPLGRSFRASEIIRQMKHYRTITNFKHHFWEGKAYTYYDEGKEKRSTPLALRAKKHYFEANQLWTKTSQKLAIQKYELWARDWKRLLEKVPEYRDNSLVQEDSYEELLKYLRRWQDYYKDDLQKLFLKAAQSGLGLGQGQLTQLGVSPLPGPSLWSSLIAFHPRFRSPLTLEQMLTKNQKDRMIPTKNIRGLFDGAETDHPTVPLLAKDAIDRVRRRIMYHGKPVPGMQPDRARMSGMPANMRGAPQPVPPAGNP